MNIVTFTMNPAIDVSASVPRVLPTHKLRCTSVRRDAGGGGINVARVIARLGGAVRALYPVGGPIGDLLKRRMDAEGVASNTVPLSQDTRESFTVEERETGLQYRFVLPGPGFTHTECDECLAAVAHMRPAPDFFVASGSLPAGVPEFAAFLVACGIDSISVSPDSFVAVKRKVAEAEGALTGAGNTSGRWESAPHASSR